MKQSILLGYLVELSASFKEFTSEIYNKAKEFGKFSRNMKLAGLNLGDLNALDILIDIRKLLKIQKKYEIQLEKEKHIKYLIMNNRCEEALIELGGKRPNNEVSELYKSRITEIFNHLTNLSDEQHASVGISELQLSSKQTDLNANLEKLSSKTYKDWVIVYPFKFEKRKPGKIESREAYKILSIVTGRDLKTIKQWHKDILNPKPATAFDLFRKSLAINSQKK